MLVRCKLRVSLPQHYSKLLQPTTNPPNIWKCFSVEWQNKQTSEECHPTSTTLPNSKFCSRNISSNHLLRVYNASNQRDLVRRLRNEYSTTKTNARQMPQCFHNIELNDRYLLLRIYNLMFQCPSNINEFTNRDFESNDDKQGH